MVKILNEIIDKYKDEIVDELRKYVQIKSVCDAPVGEFPFGENIQRAYEYIMGLAEKKGFECRNFDNYAGDVTTGEYPYIGAALHTDVVPEGDGWSVGPYSGDIEAGKIYGRGTTDNKGCTIAVLYAMIAVRESGLPLSKGLRMIVGNCEEGGEFPCIKHYMKQTELPECGIVPDAMFPAVYAEKSFYTYGYKKNFSQIEENKSGIKLIKAEGGTAVNVVAPSANAEFEVNGDIDSFVELCSGIAVDAAIEVDRSNNKVSISFEGKSAHASKPELGINAICKLTAMLENLEYDPIDVCETFKQLSKKISYDTNGAGLGVDFSDFTGYLTNNVGVLSYENGDFELRMNIRCPIHTSKETLENELIRNADEMGMEYELINYNPHFYEEKDSELIKKLMGVYQEMSGDTTSEPIAHGAGSYARVMKNFVPFGPVCPGEEVTFHQPNENISIDKLIEITKIYAQALYELAK